MRAETFLLRLLGEEKWLWFKDDFVQVAVSKKVFFHKTFACNTKVYTVKSMRLPSALTQQTRRIQRLRQEIIYLAHLFKNKMGKEEKIL